MPTTSIQTAMVNLLNANIAPNGAALNLRTVDRFHRSTYQPKDFPVAIVWEESRHQTRIAAGGPGMFQTDYRIGTHVVYGSGTLPADYDGFETLVDGIMMLYRDVANTQLGQLANTNTTAILQAGVDIDVIMPTPEMIRAGIAFQAHIFSMVREYGSR